MKKILILALNYHPFVGGAEVALREITDRLPTDEYEFHMLVPRYDRALPKEETVGNIHLHRYLLAGESKSISAQSRWPLVLNKYLYQLTAAHKASSLHKKYQFDATWIMMAHAAGIPGGVFKKRHPEVKYLLTLQEGDPPHYIEERFRLVWKHFRHAFTRADYLQTISTFLLEWGRHMGFEGPATVVPNGVASEVFSTPLDAATKQAMRKTLGIQEGEVTLITTSRLVHKNAIDVIIRALALLPENYALVVCGTGPLEEELATLVKELSLEGRVRFVGELAYSALPVALQVSSIFVRPSRSEGMGNSFIEAMAAGIPVIGTRMGGLSDFLFDERHTPNTPATGWVVDIDAPEQIREAVEAIVEAPEKVAVITSRAQTLAKTQYDWDIVASKMEAVFKELFDETPV